MTGMMTGGLLKRQLVHQFRRPEGPLGWLAGRVMAERSSNRARNLWTLELADIKPHEHVLEVGFGPGFALAEVCRSLESGHAVGLDHAPVMVRMAGARNRNSLSSGKLSLVLGAAESLSADRDPVLKGPFDCIFAVNVAFFWDEPLSVLTSLDARLTPEGALFLTLQPRMNANPDLEPLASHWIQLMSRAGLVPLGYEESVALTPPAICVFARSGLYSHN